MRAYSQEEQTELEEGEEDQNDDDAPFTILGTFIEDDGSIPESTSKVELEETDDDDELPPAITSISRDSEFIRESINGEEVIWEKSFVSIYCAVKERFFEYELVVLILQLPSLDGFDVLVGRDEFDNQTGIEHTT